METPDDNHSVLVVDKKMKSTEGGHSSRSLVTENTATLIVCPVSVLSNWMVSIVSLYFLASEPAMQKGRYKWAIGTCDRVRAWSGF